MNISTTVLAPSLYNAICDVFQHVEIANHGQPNCGPGYSGEYYRVNCYHCGDTRKRLWINYDFATRNEDGTDNLFMVHCYNEHCFDCREKQQELYDKLFPFACGRRPRDTQRERIQTPSRTIAGATQRPTPTLPWAVSLSDPMASRARQYLIDRGFDPTELETRYQVGYCMASYNPPPKIYDRIVIPVYGLRESFDISEPVLLGWQARQIGDGDASPKYLNMKGFAKSSFVYGLPQCDNAAGPVVVVEGPTDVWRLGGNAVAVFGKSVSFGQQSLLLRRLRDRPLVFMYDQDAQDESRKDASLMRGERRRFGLTAPVVHCPPPRADVGDSDRSELWECVHRALESES